jgi:tRNA threonylcarbamoyladenosine dehydratase
MHCLFLAPNFESMMDLSWLSRTELLVGREALEKLAQRHVMVIGLGGVGSFAAEFVARSGVGKMTIVDGDVVDPTNRNRQLVALATNHGVSKADIMADRIRQINPELELEVVREFIQPEMVEALLGVGPDYLIEAIDSITPKLTVISTAVKTNLSFVSSMGAGGRVDPTKLKVADIADTYGCPFAQQVRKQLKNQFGIQTGFKAVFSTEEADRESVIHTDGTKFKKSAYGTISYLPAVFGATTASVAIRDLIGLPLNMYPSTRKKPKG